MTADEPTRHEAAHPAFRRSVAAFGRLGVVVHPEAALSASRDTLAPAHPTYRAVVAAIRAAEPETATLLADASRIERACYELGMFARLLRAAAAGETEAPRRSEDTPGTTFTVADSVRLTTTQWDWDAFLADPDASEPAASAATWGLHLAASGPVATWRLHPLPALLLETCLRPVTRDEAVAAVLQRVSGDPDRLAPLVHAQLDELRAGGFVRASPATDATIDEMRRLLLADEAPTPARSLVGTLTRVVRGARTQAADVMAAGDDPHPLHLLDVMVNLLDRQLAAARLRDAFADELDGFWASVDVPNRVRSLTLLLDVLDGALGSASAMPPCVIA